MATMELDVAAIKELRAIMDARNVEYRTGMGIGRVALPNVRQMVEWLKANPEATPREMMLKALEIGESD